MFVKQNRYLVALIEVFLVALSVTCAWLLRFEFSLPEWRVLLSAMPVLILLRLVALGYFNLFHGYWCYTGVSDAIDIQKAVGFSSLAFLLLERGVLGEKRFPLSVYFIEMILTVGILVGVRVLARAVFQRAESSALSDRRKRVVVIGAGRAAAMLLRELPRSGYLPVALVDDDPRKLDVRLHGVPVVGTVKDLPAVVRHFEPEELMIAIPSATGEQMHRIVEACDRTPVSFPYDSRPGRPHQWNGYGGSVPRRQVRRPFGARSGPSRVDSVRRKIAGRVVMVTGAAGSIGSELCHQFLNDIPLKLVCVDQAETPLFNLAEFTLRTICRTKTCGSLCEIVYRVADIADSTRMREIIREHDIQVDLSCSGL